MNPLRCKLLKDAPGSRKNDKDFVSGAGLPSPPGPPPPSPPTPSPPSPGPPPPGPSPLNPELPPNRWGAFTGKPEHLAEYSFLSGVDIGCHWKNVEVIEGQFNFSSCEEQVRLAITNNR